MELCNFCLEGKTEMCKYFLEHFLEAEAPAEDCPAFKPDPENLCLFDDMEREE